MKRYISVYPLNEENQFTQKQINGLMVASENGQIDIVKDYINRGIDVNVKNDKGQTALMIASSSGKVEVVKLLLKQPKINVNQKDEDGFTALMESSAWNKLKVIKLLLNHPSININLQDNRGETALMKAVLFDHDLIIKELMKYGADFSIKDIEGKTIFDYTDKPEVKQMVLRLSKSYEDEI